MTTIRRLHPGEAGLYRELRLAALRESPEAFSTCYADAVVRGEPSWREQAEGSAAGDDRATFIASDGAPVGLAALYRDESEPEVGDLIQMWVAPGKRGGPAAAGLVGEILRWAAARGFSRIRAEVRSGNSRALGFFEKCGFVRSPDPSPHAGANVVLTRSVDAGAADRFRKEILAGGEPARREFWSASMEGIRRAVPADCRRIAEIQVAGWRAGYRGIIPDAYLDGLDAERRRGVWEGFVREGTGELFVSGEEPAGFCHLIPSRDPGAGRVAEIAAIYVDPECWRTGRGRILAAAAIQAATLLGYEHLTLWVLEENRRGRGFYEAIGLRADGARKSERSRGFVVEEVRYRIGLEPG